MKVLVTGANGYIGSKVVKQLLDFNCEVIASDINNDNIDIRAKYIQANIFEHNDNWLAYFDNPDVCLHFAWRDGFVHNSEKHKQDLPFHIYFLKNLVDNGISKIISMGSMHEVGYYEGAIDENTPCNPLSDYGKAKNDLRNEIEKYCKEKGCKFQWLRGYYVYGEDLVGNSIFSKLRQAVANGQDLMPFTTGQNKYDFLEVDELAKQISICVMQDKYLGIINVCSGKPVTLSDKVEWYIKHNNLPIKLDYGKYPDRPYDSPCVYGDSTKIRQILEDFAKENEKILVTGCNGQLGYDCIRELKERGYKNVIGVDIADFDISNEKETIEYIKKVNPIIVLHNAAWTQVDKAELNPEKVFQVNAIGTKNIALACKKIKAAMVYISSDYVFDGKGNKYFEVNDPKHGLSAYGKSKSDGEDFVTSILEKYFIVRISWAFGKNGNNFIKKMISLSKTRKEITVVDDQIGSPTYTFDLSKLLCDMIVTNKYGIYHATNENICSWCEFTKAIFAKANINDVNVIPVSTKRYMELIPTQAQRPLNSRLSKKSLDEAGFKRLPTWEDALDRYMNELLKGE